MKTLFNSLAIASCIVLSASADKAHDVFAANKDAILAQPISVYGEVAFAVGEATSPRRWGDAVGYSKAEAQAKWNLGDRFRATAPWPEDIQADEKKAAWSEYRALHPERFSVFGMQRILTRKKSPDNYLVVMSFPAAQVNVPPPSPEELKVAVEKVRSMRRSAEAGGQKTAEALAQNSNEAQDAGVLSTVEEDKKNTKPDLLPSGSDIKKQDNFDEDMML
ncbi:MAG: hypothetical protein ACI4Q3_01425 [Kiritimatiellia bacterium]